LAGGSAEVQVDHPVAKSTFFLEVEIQAQAGGKGAHAVPDNDRCNEEVACMH
jgi:hypothetical protein